MPAAVYVCEVVAPVPEVLSPKSQAYELIEPSESDEAVPLKFTASGAWPEVADAVNDATGDWFGSGAVTTIVLVTDTESPSGSLSVRRVV